LNTNQLLEWCAAYKKSWETQDPDLFVTLFTTDCSYRESPFMEPIPGREFYKFWQALAKWQQGNHIDFEILGWASNNRALLKWDATTTRRDSSEPREGSGIFLLTFDGTNRCSDVREWQHWHPRGAPLEKANCEKQ
jgi:SnoaL-like protein